MEMYRAAAVTIIIIQFLRAILKHFKGASNSKRDRLRCLPMEQNPRSVSPSHVQKDRLLYHRLQSPGQLDAETLAEARSRLIELLDQVLSNAVDEAKICPNILTLGTYSPDKLKVFVASKSRHVDAVWLQYLQRRKSGGGRELLLNREHAEYWLECAAPVKLIDGAWLAGIHHRNTPSHLRTVTRIAWQILSEELGDGDLEKNHVHLYSKLLQSFGSMLPRADTAEFVHPNANPNDDPELWSAAVAQLALSRLPDEFLPEILGFNLAFEIVAFDTLLVAHELKELRLDPSYFNLHVTIDNADSGHSAMALECVLKYLELDEPENQDRNWRGVQAGFLLATTLRSTPDAQSGLDTQVLEMFSRKLDSSSASHQSCRAIIGDLGGKNIAAWMQRQGWEKRKYQFLQALKRSSWVVPGEPEESRLYAELGWKGRMFGAFTMQEKQCLGDWIRGLETPGQNSRTDVLWKHFTWQQPISQLEVNVTGSISVEPAAIGSGSVVIAGSASHEMLPKMLLNSLIPFEQAFRSPSRAASSESMRILRILRLLHGFAADVSDCVDGMDEVVCPSQRSIFNFADRFQTLTANCRGINEDCTEWSCLETAAQDVEANYKFLLGSLDCFIVNIFTNHSLLQDLDVEEGLMVDLNCLGSKIQEQMLGLHLGEDRECQAGYELTAEILGEILRS